MHKKIHITSIVGESSIKTHNKTTAQFDFLFLRYIHVRMYFKKENIEVNPEMRLVTSIIF